MILFLFPEINNFVDTNPLNETSDNFWDYQEQDLNGVQEINTNNDTNIIYNEKRFR